MDRYRKGAEKWLINQMTLKRYTMLPGKNLLALNGLLTWTRLAATTLAYGIGWRCY
jgi:hypothetical protein